MEAAKLKAKTTGGLLSLSHCVTVTGKDYFAEPRCKLREDAQFTFTCSHEKAITDDVELNKIVKKLGLSINE